MGCRDLSYLVLNHSKHLPDSEVDAASEFVLIVDFEPPIQNLSDMGLKNLSDLQVNKLFVL